MVEYRRMQSEMAQIMFRLAWADGQVKQAEVDLIARLLEKQGVPLARRLAWMDEGLSQPPTASASADPMTQPERIDAMEGLIRLCFADGQAHDQELKLLGDLALRWGLNAEQLEELRKQAMGV